MTAIPGNFGRVPNILISQSALANLSRDMTDVSGQIASLESQMVNFAAELTLLEG